MGVEPRQRKTNEQLNCLNMTHLNQNFCIFSLSILALPMAIIGLECYSSSINLLNGGNPIEAELKNCSADAVACLIGTNKTYTGQACTNIQIPFTGCISFFNIGTTCYCTSD